jgi:hypothetical protein
MVHSSTKVDWMSTVTTGALARYKSVHLRCKSVQTTVKKVDCKKAGGKVEREVNEGTTRNYKKITQRKMSGFQIRGFLLCVRNTDPYSFMQF